MPLLKEHSGPKPGWDIISNNTSSNNLLTRVKSHRNGHVQTYAPATKKAIDVWLVITDQFL